METQFFWEPVAARHLQSIHKINMSDSESEEMVNGEVEESQSEDSDTDMVEETESQPEQLTLQQWVPLVYSLAVSFLNQTGLFVRDDV